MRPVLVTVLRHYNMYQEHHSAGTVGTHLPSPPPVLQQNISLHLIESTRVGTAAPWQFKSFKFPG